jgi:hypothetical protein
MIRAMTLAVAIAALVLSALSLAFTIYQWRRSAWHLEISVYASGPLADGRVDVQVTVINTGRLGAVVTYVYVAFDHRRRGLLRTGSIHVPAKDVEGGALPRTLAPSESLYAHVYETPAYLTDTTRLRAYAASGGRHYYSRWQRVDDRLRQGQSPDRDGDI